MNDKLNVLGSAAAVAFTTMSWTEVNIILSSIASALAILISICTLCSLIVRWFKKSTEDGKITKDEIEEGLHILEDGAKTIKSKLEEAKEKQNDKK